ncbi:hypothetical protein R6Z07F_000047 [Ovis aries]
MKDETATLGQSLPELVGRDDGTRGEISSFTLPFPGPNSVQSSQGPGRGLTAPHPAPLSQGPLREATITAPARDGPQSHAARPTSHAPTHRADPDLRPASVWEDPAPGFSSHGPSTPQPEQPQGRALTPQLRQDLSRLLISADKCMEPVRDSAPAAGGEGALVCFSLSPTPDGGDAWTWGLPSGAQSGALPMPGPEHPYRLNDRMSECIFKTQTSSKLQRKRSRFLGIVFHLLMLSGPRPTETHAVCLWLREESGS